MGNRSLRSRLLGPGPAIALSAIFLIASFLLAPGAENAELSGNYFLALISLNIVGVVVLALLTTLNIWRLIREFRANVLGSRLTLRFVGSFSILTLVPLIIVYFFAVNFLSRGIDSWFDVQIEQALDDLSRSLNNFIDRFEPRRVAIWGAGHQALAVMAVAQLVLVSSAIKLTILITFTLVVSLYAKLKGRQIKVTNLAIQSKKIKKDLHIVFISDIHIGTQSIKYLQRILTIIKKLNPQYVLIGGDLIDSSAIKINRCSSFICR